jgi:hypothetical protein
MVKENEAKYGSKFINSSGRMSKIRIEGLEIIGQMV